MGRIVRERYPAAKLPDDLRAGLPDDATVTVTLDHEEPTEDGAAVPSNGVDNWRVAASGPAEPDLPITRILEGVQDRRTSSDDPVTRIRALRAEWDRRDELHERIRVRDRP